MTLAAHTRLGPYEIQSPVGAGGMGEVYRAKDTRLDRTVAIKILASHRSTSPELKQRMEREARAISSLNHPHICRLYDVGSQDGADYLVMEFLEGETLGERLSKGAMPLGEILKIGTAIADALAVAHRQGIVHRDLKPSNIMLTHGGAKLMDFGLAKPLGVAGVAGSGTAPLFTAAPTLSSPSPLMSPLTTAGSIVGTIQYMSPEQIEGKEADARSDIFALGAVLYEMAAGKRPFEGKSQLSLASSILEKDPEPISSLKPLLPTAFEHIVATCLQKNPEERFQTAHDVKLALQWIALDQSAPAVAVQQPSSASGRERLGWAAAILAAVALGALAGIFFHRPAQSARTISTVIDPPEKTTLNLAGDAAGPPVLSPDGTAMAFTASGADAKTSIWVRPMNSPEARALPETGNAIFPFWSPDGRSLGFFADGKLKTVDLAGGSPTVVCDAPFGRGGAWAPGGVILFAPDIGGPLSRVSASGGTAVAFTKLDAAQHTSHRWPFFLPDGRHFIYLAINHDAAKSGNDGIYYASLDGREPDRLLLRAKSNAVYASGLLLFARGDQLMARPFDAATGALGGEPQNLARGLINDFSTWHMDASASDDLLVFANGSSADLQLAWMDRRGRLTGTVAEKLFTLQALRLSPQGDRLALAIDTGMVDIWVLDILRGVRTRLTFGPVSNRSPIWSPDGKWIAYTSNRDGRFQILRKRSDGSGGEELLHTDDESSYPSDWTADGRYLIYSHWSSGPLPSREVWGLPLEGDRKPWLIVPSNGNSLTGLGRVSPDGRWIVYVSTESGSMQVYVVAFRGGQGKWQVSANGGNVPQWSHDGKELFYLDTTYSLFAVPVKDAGGALQFGAPNLLISNLSAPQIFYDVSPDGKRILVDRVSQQVSQSLTVVTNFPALLKK